ncbi:MAG: hypothetical protein M9894_38655 [Planctomycetes bacterium]|nr:hypothetical protein [Planctomycetota bacterium]
MHEVTSFVLVFVAGLAGIALSSGVLVLLARGASTAWRRARTVVTPSLLHRPSLLERSWTLEVEPERVRLHVRAGPLAWPAFGFVLFVLWVGFVMPLVRPLLDRFPALRDPRGTAAVESMRGPVSFFKGALVLGAAVYALAHALRRTDLILESQGDVRFVERGLLGAAEWSLPMGEFDSLVVEPDGEVCVRWRDGPGFARTPVFRTARKPLSDLQADMALAHDGLVALIRRRASGAC